MSVSVPSDATEESLSRYIDAVIEDGTRIHLNVLCSLDGDNLRRWLTYRPSDLIYIDADKVTHDLTLMCLRRQKGSIVKYFAHAATMRDAFNDVCRYVPLYAFMSGDTDPLTGLTGREARRFRVCYIPMVKWYSHG